MESALPCRGGEQRPVGPYRPLQRCGCRGIGRPELEEVALVQALVTYRLDVEADELDKRAKRHHTDFNIRVDPPRARWVGRGLVLGDPHSLASLPRKAR